MVASPNYEQLMRFAQAAEKGLIQLEEHDPLHRQTIEGLTGMIDRVKHFRAYQGFEGLTGDAIRSGLRPHCPVMTLNSRGTSAASRTTWRRAAC